MKKPFKPLMAGKAPAAAKPKLSPIAEKGKAMFHSHSCFECHGQGAVGTTFAPRLIGIGKKFTLPQMIHLFKHPLPAMNKGGMPHFTFTPDQVKALRTYLDSLQ